jgi:hypothetical protein
MRDDDLGAALAAGGRPGSVPAGLELVLGAPKSARAGKGRTRVTIYSGKDCKLYDLVREGELLAR